MLSKCATLALGFVLTFVWVPHSHSGVSSQPVGDSQVLATSTEISPGAIVVAARQETPSDLEMPREVGSSPFL